jgi:hypothetical protein
MPLSVRPRWNTVPKTMDDAKRQRRIQASEIDVGSRTLEAVLRDLAEQEKTNAERSARAEERSARAEERSARAEERSARAEEHAAIALHTIAAVTQDLRAITQELRASNARSERRLDMLEKAAGLQESRV